jgi:small subunit ribosomal protein S6
MPANIYECMFLLDTNKVAGDVPNAAKQLHGILERNNAEILASRPWDERRLAYPIGNHKKGLYYLTYFRTEGKNLTGIDHDCRLSELILRQMVLKVHPKLVDTMLALARDEHALALQSMHEEGADNGPRGDRGEKGEKKEGEGEAPEGRGPRRGEGRGPRRPEPAAEKS